jgi:4-hydroxy-3-methylbut-2-enyl diphosphate reductase
LCERKFPTYFISSEKEIQSKFTIHHYDYPNKKHIASNNYLPEKENLKIIVTGGASCPDSVIENVIHKLNSFFTDIRHYEDVLKQLEPQ